ncbi:MAG TPA: hypothetical protein VIF12_07440 [Micavibrio sp.]
MKHLFHILVFLAFAMQSIIPVGFMPDIDASAAGTKLVICSGIGEKIIYLDRNGQPVEHKEFSKCSYSILSSGGQPVYFALAAPVYFDNPAEPFYRIAKISGLSFLTRDSTGPPALS